MGCCRRLERSETARWRRIGAAGKAGGGTVDLFLSGGITEFNSVMESGKFLPGGASLKGVNSRFQWERLWLTRHRHKQGRDPQGDGSTECSAPT